MRVPLTRALERLRAAWSRLHGLPGPTWVAVALALLVAPFAGTSPALAVIPLEAEDATGFLNVGGSVIQSVICSAARGGMAVDGVDYAGDYIEWQLSLPADFSFRDSLRSAGSVGLVREFIVQFFASGVPGPPIVSDTLVTPAGLGIG